jgi:hypothetical protein
MLYPSDRIIIPQTDVDRYPKFSNQAHFKTITTRKGKSQRVIFLNNHCQAFVEDSSFFLLSHTSKIPIIKSITKTTDIIITTSLDSQKYSKATHKDIPPTNHIVATLSHDINKSYIN